MDGCTRRSGRRATPEPVEKTGHRIKRVVVSGGKAVKHEVFAESWLQGESAWGRPVEVEFMRDGSLLVSDDHAGAIYRISYRGK